MLASYQKEENVVLKVKRLNPNVKLPTVSHPGTDLGYDLYCPTGVLLVPRKVNRIALGIAVELEGHGFLIRERSSWQPQERMWLAG